MKAVILFVVINVILQKGYANQIDSLTTKEEVLEFLTSDLKDSNVSFLFKCANISQTPEISYYLSHPDTLIDTTVVVDPNTLKEEIKYVPREYNPYDNEVPDTYNYRTLSPWKDMQAALFNRYSLHFEKADIDHNGLTDLLIKAGATILIMNIGGTFKGYVLNSGVDSTTFNFRGFKKLSDGSLALLFRHDYNKCILSEHLLKGKVTYVTDTTGFGTSIVTIDTLYKIIMGVDTEHLGKCHYPNDKIVHPYTDTVDMKLYNKIDTIVYKYGGFTKYHPQNNPARITKIDYYFSFFEYGWKEKTSCIEINNNGLCFLKYLDQKHQTNFSSLIDRNKLNDLWNFIAYADLQSKKDDYSCSWSHTGVYVFAVYFDDGTVKKIRCSATAPMIELGSLSQRISDISSTVNWQPSEKRTDFECPCTLPPLPNNDTENCDCNDPDRYTIYD